MIDKLQVSVQPPMFKRERACICCGGVKLRGECGVVSITPQMYRKDSSGRKVKMGRGVNVCEPCLVRALVGGNGNPEWRKLRRAIGVRLRSLYNVITDAPKKASA